jgi:hypothetical protein
VQAAYELALFYSEPGPDECPGESSMAYASLRSLRLRVPPGIGGSQVVLWCRAQQKVDETSCRLALAGSGMGNAESLPCKLLLFFVDRYSYCLVLQKGIGFGRGFKLWLVSPPAQAHARDVNMLIVSQCSDPQWGFVNYS